MKKRKCRRSRGIADIGDAGMRAGWGIAAGVTSLVIALVLLVAWIHGRSYQTHLQTNVGNLGLRAHWTNGVLVVMGLRYSESGGELFDFRQHALNTGFGQYEPGVVANVEVLDFGLIWYEQPLRESAVGLTLPIWSLVLLFGLLLPALLFTRRAAISYTTCPKCQKHFEGRFRSRRIECPQCGNIFMPLYSKTAETVLTDARTSKPAGR